MFVDAFLLTYAIVMPASCPRWAEEILTPHKLDVHSFEGSGRGLRTLRDRSPGEVLLSVNDAQVVTADRILEAEPVLKAIAQHAAHSGPTRLNEEHVLCLFLLSNQLEDSTGPWAQYVGALPEVQPGPLSMHDEAALLPRCYELVVDAALRHARAQCHVCILAVRAACEGADLGPKLLSDLTELYEQLSEQTYLWAFATVRARSIEVSGSLSGVASPLLAAPPRHGSVRALFPGLDMLNHRPTAKTTLYKRASGAWELVSRDAYRRGEQVYATYGPRDNLKLLMTYGFALRDNPVREVYFDTEDLVVAFREARPAVFNPVVASLVLAQLNAVSSAGGDEGDMPLFGFDASALRPKESLAGGLRLMAELTKTLSDDGEEGDDLMEVALCAMLRTRLEEARGKLEYLAGAHRPAEACHDTSDDTHAMAMAGATCSIRTSVEALVGAEVEMLEEAVERQAELRCDAVSEVEAVEEAKLGLTPVAEC